MRNSFLWILVLMLAYFVIFISGKKLRTWSSYVDPMIGNGGEGFGVGSDPPGVQRPFGGCRLSPDTINWENYWIGFNHFSGYWYGDDYIRVFSHVHMVGPGVADLGLLGVMPLDHIPMGSEVENYGYRSYFTHDNESAQAGYYNVWLQTPNIFAELTATEHVGLHKYTFLNNRDNVILFYVSHTLDSGKSCADSETWVDIQNNEVTGWVLGQGALCSRFGGCLLHFVAQFSTQITNFGTWTNNTITLNSTHARGNNIGSFVDFGESTVEVKVGISWISVDQARSNIQAQTGTNTFDQVREQTQDIWEAALSKVSVVSLNSTNREELIKFYTSLYHTMLAPTMFNEQESYVGFDKQTHQIPTGHNYYTDMSIWDTHRTEFPWIGFLEASRLSDIVQSLVLMYLQGGYIPRWPFIYGYTGCMIATHAHVVIADAYVKGIRDFDVQSAYKGMIQGSTTQQPTDGRDDIADWLSIGYIASDKTDRSASKTLEYAYDDWALSQLALALGNQQDHETFYNRSMNYKNNWNNYEQLFCPLDSKGNWDCPDLWTNVFDGRYVEGDAWHWRWFAPHDVAGLIALFGSNKTFVEQLDIFFSRSEDDPFNVLPNPYYWAGNEPDIFAPWMFNFAGRPDLTQKYTRWNMKHKYTIHSDGLPGNDDYGTMSAWYMFAALGFYPLAGSQQYMIGSPVFQNVVVTGENFTLNVVAHDATDLNIYVQKARIGNRVIDVIDFPFVYHFELAANTTIEFWMGDKPPKRN